MAADQRLGADLSWGDIHCLTACLAGRIRLDNAPEIIVGIMRGGMVPAVMLAHQFGVRDVRTVEVTHTAGDGINADKTQTPQYRNPASLGDLTGRDVLLVDDIAGSGATLDRTRRILRALGPRRVRTAVLTVNQANWHTAPGPDAQIDYIAQHCEGWVIFPWEIR